VENSTAVGAFSYTTADNQVALGNDDVREIRAFGQVLASAQPAAYNYFLYNGGNLSLTGGGNVGIGAQSMSALTTGGNNVAFGNSAMRSLTSSSGNVAIGHDAMRDSVTSTDCTAIGIEAMRDNVSGVGSTAVGRSALKSNAGGEAHTAVGAYALTSNTTGFQNVAVGYRASEANVTGSYNTVFGNDASRLRTAGDENVAIGRLAMGGSSAAANRNVAVGHGALESFGGDDSTAVGHSALNAATGGRNTAIGANAGASITSGVSNVFVGLNAGSNVAQLASAQNSIAIGVGAYTTANNQTVLGNADTAHTALRGRVGIGLGLGQPEGVLHVRSDGTSANLPVVEIAEQTTDAMHWSMRICASKTTAPGDGFGPSINLQHRQGTGTRNTIGLIGAVRDGADNTGEIRLRPALAGGLADGLAVTRSAARVGWSTPIPAGGSNTTGYKMSLVPDFGIFYGSGAPTLSAAKGSMYLRSDGTGVNDRAYINTNGGTTWTAIVTVA